MALAVELVNTGNQTGIQTVVAGGGLPRDGLELLYQYLEGNAGSPYSWQTNAYGQPLVLDTSGYGRHGIILPYSTMYRADWGVTTEDPSVPLHTVTVTGAVWSNTAGGQTTFTVSSDPTSFIFAGSKVVVANTAIVVTQPPGAGYNGFFTVVSTTSSTIVVTHTSASSPGTYTSGGNISTGMNRGFSVRTPLPIQAFDDFSIVFIARNRAPYISYQGVCGMHGASFGSSQNGNNDRTELLLGQNRTISNNLYLAMLSLSTFVDPGFSWVNTADDNASWGWKGGNVGNTPNTNLYVNNTSNPKDTWICGTCAFDFANKKMRVRMAGVTVEITSGVSPLSLQNYMTKWLTAVTGFHMLGAMSVSQSSASAQTVCADIALQGLYSYAFDDAESDNVCAAAIANFHARPNMSGVLCI